MNRIKDITKRTVRLLRARKYDANNIDIAIQEATTEHDMLRGKLINYEISSTYVSKVEDEVKPQIKNSNYGRSI